MSDRAELLRQYLLGWAKARQRDVLLSENNNPYVVATYDELRKVLAGWTPPATGYEILNAGLPVENRRCSKCGIPEADSKWGHLIDIRVVVADGEEGFADVTQLLCDEHSASMMDKLVELGFVDHRHGSINFLEDQSCPGTQEMDDCPAPTEYGPITVPPPSVLK